MKVFKSYQQLNLIRDIVAFFNLEVGVGRGPATDLGKSELLARAQQRVTRQRQQLEKRKEQITARENRIKALQDQIVNMRTEASGDGELGKTRASAEDGGNRPGTGLKPGDPHYRSWVGQPKSMT